MIRSVVIIRWNADVTPDQRAAAVAGLDSLPSLIPEVRSYLVREDAGNNPDASGLVILADFDDVEGFRIYRNHPEHLAVHTSVVAPISAGAMSMQIDWVD